MRSTTNHLLARVSVATCMLAVVSPAQTPTPTYTSATNPNDWRCYARDANLGPGFANTLTAGTLAGGLAVFQALSNSVLSAIWLGDQFVFSASVSAAFTSGSEASAGADPSGEAAVVITFDAPQPWIGFIELDWSFASGAASAVASLALDVGDDGSTEFSRSFAIFSEDGTFSVPLSVPAGPFDVRVSIATSVLNAAASAVTARVKPVNSVGSVVAYGEGCRPVSFYEQFVGSGDLDLSGQAMALIPSDGGYEVLFGPGGIDPNFGTDLLMGDDTVVNQNLGLTVQVPGVIGDVTAIDISSNGVCAPSLSGVPTQHLETVSEFLATPMFAVCWDDFDPSAGGGVYFKHIPATPLFPFARSVVTWAGVPQNGMADSNTFQITFYETGPVTYAWGQLSDDGIVGFSSALSALDPGPVDLSASPGLFTGNVPPLRLDALTVPAVGSTLDLLVSGIQPSAVMGLVLWGFVEASMPLDGIGAPPGCVLLTSGDFVSTPIDLSTGLAPFAISSSPAWLGLTFYAQSVAVDPSIPATVPVVLSNGIEVIVGS